MSNFENDFYCDCCGDDKVDTLHEGWFYTEEKLNPWAQGTASASLMQKWRVCDTCLEKVKHLWVGNKEKA